MQHRSHEPLPFESISTLTLSEAKAVVADLLGGKLRVAQRFEHGGRWLVVFDERHARPFSARERAILEQSARGTSGKVVAIELGIACSTVSTRLGVLVEAIGLASRAELAAIAALGAADMEAAAEDAPSWTAVTQGIARAVHAGSAKLVASFRLVDVARLEQLTPAEREVVRAAVAGKTNAEIARARHTSPNTVANQLARVYRKLKVGSRWALAGCPSNDFSPLSSPA